MIQLQWRDNTISVSQNTYQRIKEISESFKIKKKSDNTSSTVVITGSELQSFNIEMPIVNQNAMELYEHWREQLGTIGPILMQGSLFGPDYVMLHKVALRSDAISNDGIILSGSLILTFEEEEPQGKNFKSNSAPYISPVQRSYYQDSPQAVEDLKLKVFYNDTDITEAIDVNSCIHDMYACSMADTLTLTFNDINKVWDGWNAEKEEYISITHGIAKSGKMYIDTVKPENGLMTLRASTMPPTGKKKNNKSWEDVKILQLGQEFADRHGLGFESYGVENYLYSYVRQDNEPDFDFLQKRCDLESLAFVIYDKKLIIYSENYLESQTPAEDINLGAEADFVYTDDSLQGFGSITVKNGDISGTYTASNGLTRSDERIISTYMSSQAEANRFAKGILRQENKNLASGYWRDTLRRELSAGSVLNLKTLGAASWNGKIFVKHIRQDYVNSKSKIFFRGVNID